MTSSASSDPYYVARDTVSQAVSELQAVYRKWGESLTADSMSFGAFADATKGLLQDVGHIEEDLSVIESSVRVVEANPIKYPLRPGELDARKLWITNQRRVCNDIRARANGPQAKAKLDSDKKRAAAAEADAARQKRAADDANTSNVNATKQVHEQIINQQDETLNELARVTTRIGETAVVMSSELKDQERLLGDLGRDIDRQQEKMNYVMGKLAKLLKTSDTKQLMLVLVLVVVAILLFMWNLGV